MVRIVGFMCEFFGLLLGNLRIHVVLIDALKTFI